MEDKSSFNSKGAVRAEEANGRAREEGKGKRRELCSRWRKVQWRMIMGNKTSKNIA